MFQRILLLLVLTSLGFTFSGCTLHQERKQIESELADVRQKAQELALKEKELDAREEILNERQKTIDSVLTANDTISKNFPNLPGNYSAKMVCTEANCSGFAIGDIKIEQWNISFMGNMLVAKAMNNKDQLIRVYTGKMIDNNQLMLTYEATELHGNEDRTKMVVMIKPKNETTWEGSRKIINPNDCQVGYSLELKKLK